MASKRDARDLLGLGDEDSPKIGRKPRSETSVAAPAKVVVGGLAKKARLGREVKNLVAPLKGDVVVAEAPSVKPMKKKARLAKKVVPWQPFHYANREGPGSMTLTHVRPLDDPVKETNTFLRFNLPLKVERYTDEQYQRLLVSSDWSREETDMLMQLVERFDARLVVVHDRWELRPRTLEEIKARYYQIQKVLSGAGSAFSYDLEAALLRKRHAEILYNRTGFDVWEEFEASKEFEPIAAELAKAQLAPSRARNLLNALEVGSNDGPEGEEFANQDWSPSDAQARGRRKSNSNAAIVSAAASSSQLPQNVDKYLRGLNVPVRPSSHPKVASLHSVLRSHVMVLLDMEQLLRQKSYEVALLKYRLAAVRGEFDE